jgi:hypothetical protein
LSGDREIAGTLAAHEVPVVRASARDGRSGGAALWILTRPATRTAVERARAALSASAGCSTFALRALAIE